MLNTRIFYPSLYWSWNSWCVSFRNFLEVSHFATFLRGRLPFRNRFSEIWKFAKWETGLYLKILERPRKMCFIFFIILELLHFNEINPSKNCNTGNLLILYIIIIFLMLMSLSWIFLKYPRFQNFSSYRHF